MKRILFFLGFAGLLVPQLAFAHTFKTNGTISALLHVEPNDSPVAGKPSSMYFFITDKNNQLQPSKCDCQVVVKEDGKTLVSKPLFADLSDQPNGLNAQIPIKFPKKDVYDITITGSPKGAAGFLPFSFEYSQRVDKSAGFSLSPVSVAVGALLLAAFILVQRIIAAAVGRSAIAKAKV